MKLKRTIAGIISSLILTTATNFSAAAIEKDITLDGNKITITASDCGQLNYIAYSKDRYICEIENGTLISEKREEFSLYDYNTFYLKDNDIPVTITLTPTGKFRENTEVFACGNYYIMEKTEINGSYSLIGDINCDGRNGIADMVLLQKYILGMIDFTIPEFYHADMVRDGQIDSFDMVLMRQLILRNINN